MLKLIFILFFLVNCEAVKNNNTELKFTYYSNDKCLFKIKYENYEIFCNNLEDFNKCCNHNANYLYNNISYFKKNSKNNCFKYNNKYLNYNCDKLPLSNDIVKMLFYLMLMLQKNPINYEGINKDKYFMFYSNIYDKRNNSYGKIIKNNGIIKINENEFTSKVKKLNK